MRKETVAALIGAAFFLWMGLLLAPGFETGFLSGLAKANEALSHPFTLTICSKSASVALLSLLFYGGILLFLKENIQGQNKLHSHGSGHWGNPFAFKARYGDKKEENNMILTEHTAISLNTHRHMRNLNTLVVGGSGAGKSRFYVLPNALSLNNVSLIFTDPKSALCESVGHILKDRGYKIRVLDLLHMERSHGYNPFRYLRDDNDVQRLITNLFQNTTPKNSRSQDPFWDQAASMLLSALVYYLLYEAPPEEQNFATVMEMIRAGETDGENEKAKSPLDRLFDALEKRNPEHVALKYYRSYRSGSVKTLKSIQLSLMTRLEKFNLDSLASLTAYDEMDLDKIGLEKTALFCAVPDNDTSFNFLVSLLYTQLFQMLYARADAEPSKRLPVPVMFFFDEFATTSRVGDFDKLLATMRSRGISVSIILQNVSQLKKLFEKEWESIIGNCDSFLYLGGNEESTHEYVSKLLGKETITYRESSRSKGRSGSFSTSEHKTARDLLQSAEVRMLDNRKALLFVRGESPIEDEKYDVTKHPLYEKTAEGGGKPFVYGTDTESTVLLSLTDAAGEETEDTRPVPSVECLSDTELYDIFVLDRARELCPEAENSRKDNK